MPGPRTFLTLLAVTLIVACVPLSSKNPFGHRSNDSELAGTWSDGDMQMVIRRKGRGKLLATLSTLDEEETDAFSLEYSMLTSLIDDMKFLSIKQVWSRKTIEGYARQEEISVREARSKLRQRDKRMDGWYLAHYTIAMVDEGDRLDILLMDEDSQTVTEALEQGALKGGLINVKDEDGEDEEIVYLTSSSHELDDFVAGHMDVVDDLFELDLKGFIRQ